jgi:signal-transduction protein with cAMP-binding, CBS, and nucleotidyltransferase domain
MTIVDKVLALKALEPFSSLEGAELFVIAGITKARVYQPGEKMFPGGKPFSHVYITVRGRVIFPDGSSAPEVLGVESLIGDEIFQRDVIAGTETECLLIPKEHFFTIMHECPALAAGFIGIIQRRKLGGARKA